MSTTAISLGVWLGSTRVGTLVHFPSEATVFGFDPGYEADPDRPILSLSMKGPDGALVAPRVSSVVLPPWFANLLPEGHLRQYIAAKARVKDIREFFLLAQLGQDLAGAVAVRPDTAPPPGLNHEELTALVPEAGALRFSLAGVQLKFSAIRAAQGGLTIPASGAGGDWIVKLPSLQLPNMPLHEKLILDLAEANDIKVPERRLVQLDEVEGLPTDLGELAKEPVLAVRRFDRTPQGRVHIEDFAQVLGLRPEDKYGAASSEHIGKVLRAETPEEDILEFVRRLVFSILVGNADMHLKNWSLIYPDGRTARLAPAYDLVGTVAFTPDLHLGLTIGGESDMRRVTRSTFASFATEIGMPISMVGDLVSTSIAQFRRVWSDHTAVSQLPKAQRERLKEHQGKLHLLIEH
jgi:serine/threonine-protein kinase HipA